MKKFYTILAIAAMLLAAQPSQARIRFGLRGGANLVNMKFNEGVIDKNNRTGFYVGPTMKFTLPLIGLGFDVSALYDQKNVKIEDKSVNSQAIALPINVRYGYGLGDLFNVFAFTGPQFAFNLGSDKNVYESVKDWTWKSSQFSWNVGIGFTLLDHVEIKGNYNIACSKTGEFKATDALVNGVKGKYNTWQIGVAYWF